MKIIKYRLVLDVDFDPQGNKRPFLGSNRVLRKDLKHNLYRIMREALNNGTLTGETDAVVDTYKFSVKERRQRKKKSTYVRGINELQTKQGFPKWIWGTP